MRVNCKSLLLSHYGTGVDVYIATSNGDNRIVAFDSKAILSLTWKDDYNSSDNFGISVNRHSLLKLIREIRPKNGFYEFKITDDYVNIFDNFGYLEQEHKGFIGSMPYKFADPNRFNEKFLGLQISRSEFTGNITLDYNKFRSVVDFLSSIISSGVFNCGEVRVVNFQIVNEQMPLVIQAYVKFDGILGNLDVAVFPFVE